MLRAIRTVAIGCVLLCLSGVLVYAQQERSSQNRDDQARMAGERQTMSAEQLVAQWPATCQKAYKEMVGKYGQPDGVTPTRLIWSDKGQFKEIILLNQEFRHDFPKPHTDCLEHVVEFKVPAEKVADLAKFDGSVIVDRTRGTIGARCDSEAHNLVALNLAYQIINGKLDVERARQMYADGAKQEMAGKTPDIAQKLMFQPIRNGGDPDVALIPGQPGEAQPAAERQPARER